ncbi:uncharacterized protein LOC125267349 isoform X1 [Megalobrama amblycephala]|uniref:uncharacterized protein LOC125267349 isoform X1 n=1 Tax=Megalobrama amblycephala TaxID=75352 RepID=UPI0020143279|nr:uncharacterized protein LOC125267349 isoform X1 [Megalobrama amblycephala]
MLSKMTIEKIRTAVLTEKSGKCVCVERKRKPSSSYQLVLHNHQGDSPKVTVYDISRDDTERKDTKINYMAFCFEDGDKNTFFPVADGTKNKLEVVKNSESSITEFMKDTFKEKYLFQWGKSGTNDWQSLKSVAEPNMFLCVEKGRGKEKVTINSVEEPSFQIKTVETLFPRTQNSSGSDETQNLTPQNLRATSKDLQVSEIPCKLKYARIQCNWSPESAKTRTRYSTLINQRAASKGKPRKNKMSMKI